MDANSEAINDKTRQNTLHISFERKDEQEKIAPPAIYDDYQFDSCISLIIKTSESKTIPAEKMVALLPKRFARGTIRLSIDGIQEIGAFP
ncbi:hypothetical protein CGH68_25015, partial [Vibrio parahaemolyticus]